MSTIKIMLVRHAEKPTAGFNGVTVQGEQNKEELIVQGWQRAGALVGLFAPYPGTPLRAGISTPGTLFASGSASLRPAHTLLPLADKLNKTVEDSIKKDDVSRLVSAALSAGGVVLIAWQHEDIPAIANAIVKNAVPIPSVWPGDRFDLVWILDGASSQGPWTFSQVPQLLLAGDSESVIPLQQ
jgi:hypothetical protein